MYSLLFGFLFFIVQNAIFVMAEDRPKNLPQFPDYKNKAHVEKSVEDYPFVMNDVEETFIEPREFDIFIYQADGVVFYTKYKRYNPNGVRIRDRVRINFLNNMEKVDQYSLQNTQTYRTRIMAPTTLLGLNNTTDDNIGVEYYQHLKYPLQYKDDIETAMKKDQENVSNQALNPYQIERKKKEEAILNENSRKSNNN